jgi:hypothetical protein
MVWPVTGTFWLMVYAQTADTLGINTISTSRMIFLFLLLLNYFQFFSIHGRLLAIPLLLRLRSSSQLPHILCWKWLHMEMWKEEEVVEVKIALRMNTTVSLNMTKDNPYGTANLNMNTLHNQDSGKFWVWENTLIQVPSTKLKPYWSIIRSIVTYACEVWVLQETIKNKLMVFERKVLRKTFGPTKKEMVHGQSKQMMN